MGEGGVVPVAGNDCVLGVRGTRSPVEAPWTDSVLLARGARPLSPVASNDFCGFRGTRTPRPVSPVAGNDSWGGRCLCLERTWNHSWGGGDSGEGRDTGVGSWGGMHPAPNSRDSQVSSCGRQCITREEMPALGEEARLVVRKKIAEEDYPEVQVHGNNTLPGDRGIIPGEAEAAEIADGAGVAESRDRHSGPNDPSRFRASPRSLLPPFLQYLH